MRAFRIRSGAVPNRMLSPILSVPDEILAYLIGIAGGASLHAIKRTCLRLQRVPVDTLEMEILVDGVRTVRQVVFLTPSLIADKLRAHIDSVVRSDLRPINHPNHMSLAYPQRSQNLPHDEPDFLAPWRTYPRENLHVDKMWGTTHATHHVLLDAFRYDVNTHWANCVSYDDGYWIPCETGNLLPCNGNDITNRLRIRTRLVRTGMRCIDFDEVPRVGWAVLMCPLTMPYENIFPDEEDDRLYDTSREITENVCFTNMQVSLSYGALRVLLTMKMTTNNGKTTARRCRSNMHWVDTWVAEVGRC